MNSFVRAPLLLAAIATASATFSACGSDPAVATPPAESPALSVAIMTPEATAYTNGTVSFRVSVTGEPEVVELLAGGASIATLQAPYTFEWDTRGQAEGKVQVVARATRAGSTQVESMPRLVVIDRTPPAVVTRLPKPGSANVAVGEAITLEVSEPLRVETIDSMSVALQSGSAPVARSVSLSADGTKLTIKPDVAPVAPATMSATLAAGITDLAGNALVLPAEPWTWTLPFWVPLGEPPGVGVVVIDKTGAPCMLGSSKGGLVTVQCWDGKQWSATTGEVVSGGALAAFDKAGAPLVTGTSGADAATRVFVERWDGTAWKRLGGPLLTGQFCFGVSLVVDPSGAPVAASKCFSSPKGAVAQRWDGSTWKPFGEAQVFNPATDPIDPIVVVDAMGRPTMAWNEYAQAAGRALYVRRWNGSAWEAIGGSPSKAVGDPESGSDPRMRLDASGNPILTWVSGGDLIPRAVRWTGSAWALIGAAFPRSNVYSFPLAVGSDGMPVVAREGAPASDPTARSVYVERWSGTAWKLVGDRLSVSPPSADLNITFDMTVDDKDRAIVSWSELVAGKRNVYLRRENK